MQSFKTGGNNCCYLKSCYSAILLFSMIIVFSGSPSFGQVRDQQGGLTSTAVSNLIKKTKGSTVALPLKLALSVALENNLDIQIQKVSIPISEKGIIEQDAHFDPVFFGEVSGRRLERQTSSSLSGNPISKENEQFGKLGIRKLFKFGLEAETYFETSRYRNNSSFEGLDPQYRNMLILSLRQPLLQDFGQKINTTNIQIAENRLKIMRNSFVSQVIQTLDLTEQTYYDLLRAIKTQKLREESLRLAKNLLRDNQDRFNAGLTHVGEVQEAETAVVSRMEKVIEAGQELENASNALKNILQIGSDSPLYHLTVLTDESYPAMQKYSGHEEALGLALQNRPDYLQKKIEIKNRNVVLKYTKNQLLPRLDIIGTFGLNGLSGEAKTISFAGESSKSPFGGDYADSLDHLTDADGYEWMVGLTLEIPIGNRADRSRYDQAGLDRKRAIMDLKNLEDKIDLEIKVALENIESSAERISITDRFVRLAAKTLAQEEERLKGGLSDTFRVLIFQTNLIDAEIKKVRAQTDYQKQLAGLYMVMGKNIERHNMHVNFSNKMKHDQ